MERTLQPHERNWRAVWLAAGLLGALGLGCGGGKSAASAGKDTGASSATAGATSSGATGGTGGTADTSSSGAGTEAGTTAPGGDHATVDGIYDVMTALPALPRLENVVGVVGNDSVVIRFQPVDDARDYYFVDGAEKNMRASPEIAFPVLTAETVGTQPLYRVHYTKYQASLGSYPSSIASGAAKLQPKSQKLPWRLQAMPSGSSGINRAARRVRERGQVDANR